MKNIIKKVLNEERLTSEWSSLKKYSVSIDLDGVECTLHSVAGTFLTPKEGVTTFTEDEIKSIRESLESRDIMGWLMKGDNDPNPSSYTYMGDTDRISITFDEVGIMKMYLEIPATDLNLFN